MGENHLVGLAGELELNGMHLCTFTVHGPHNELFMCPPACTGLIIHFLLFVIMSEFQVHILVPCYIVIIVVEEIFKKVG